MFYKLLGYLVWNGAKVFLRSRYGSIHAPKPVVAGVAVAAVAAVALAVAGAKRNGSSD